MADETFVPFSEWTMQRATEKVKADLDVGVLVENRLFYQGDHWQDATQWIGPWPDPLNAVTAIDVAKTQQEIEKGFTPRNALKEVIERHVTGVIGHEPDWGFSPMRPMAEDDEPTDAEKAQIDELELALTKWWDVRGIAEKLQEATRRLLYSAGQAGAPSRVALRIYVPRGLLVDEQRQVNGETVNVRALRISDFDDALSKLFVDVTTPEIAHVYTEPATMADIGIYVTKINGLDRAELTYLDDGGKTVLRVVSTGDTPSQAVSFDLGRRLLMAELRRPDFVTEPMRAAQRALNLSNSMLPRNSVTAGFLEQAILNGEMPGHFEGEGAERQWVRDPHIRGAGITNWIAGIETETPEGGKALATPQVVNRPPVDSQPVISTKREHYRDILEEAAQLHVLIGGDAVASGFSREQARGDHLASLGQTQLSIERVGRWLLETVTAYAEALSNAPGKYTKNLRATFTCQIDPGPLSAEELNQITTAVQANQLSRVTGMVRAGIRDPDAEIHRINEQDGGAIALSKLKADTYKAWIDAGCTDEAAAELSGLSDAEKKIIGKMVTDLEAKAREVPPNNPGTQPPTPGRTQPPTPGRTPQPPRTAGAGNVAA